MTPNRLQLVQGDITQMQVDAIVNAANESLLGGGGVDGAIHRAAGLGLLEECRSLGGCPTGQARITRGYKLPATWVIHTVGPVYRDGQQGEPQLLQAAYQSCLELAARRGLARLAFPSISTGAYGYPLEQAAPIALKTLAAGLRQYPGLTQVTLVCFDRRTLDAYTTAWAELEPLLGEKS